MSPALRGWHAAVLRGLANVHQVRGEVDLAIDRMQEAVDTAESVAALPHRVAEIRFRLARMYYGKPELRPAAVLLALACGHVLERTASPARMAKFREWIADPGSAVE